MRELLHTLHRIRSGTPKLTESVVHLKPPHGERPFPLSSLANAIIFQRPPTGDRGTRFQHCLRCAAVPVTAKIYSNLLLHYGCALLSHRSVERLYSESASKSESHPHIRHLRMLLALQPEAKGTSSHTEYTVREPSPMNGTVSAISMGLTHPF